MALSLNPIKAALAPYVIYIKLVFIAALFVGGVFTGCEWEEGRNSKHVAAVEKERDTYKEQSNVNALALQEVNKQYEANKQAALEWKERAEVAANFAKKEKEKNEDLQSDFQKRLAKAKTNPDCKAIMEMNLCPTLRDY